MYGLWAMLCPAGHSFRLKIIGQFSIVSRTPWSWACLTMSGQIRSASSQFPSWVFAWSPPRNVFTNGTPMRLAATMTCRRWPITCLRWAGSGWRGFG